MTPVRAGVPFYFYPRPPRGGRRGTWYDSTVDLIFLSTPSARRATGATLGKAAEVIFLSTPSARRATRYDRAGLHRLRISIHALREEGDARTPIRSFRRTYFYPRPPRGGRPCGVSPPHPRRRISIHALREEGDFCGGVGVDFAVEFLSTPSARRATSWAQTSKRER